MVTHSGDLPGASESCPPVGRQHGIMERTQDLESENLSLSPSSANA